MNAKIKGDGTGTTHILSNQLNKHFQNKSQNLLQPDFVISNETVLSVLFN